MKSQVKGRYNGNVQDRTIARNTSFNVERELKSDSKNSIPNTNSNKTAETRIYLFKDHS